MMIWTVHETLITPYSSVKWSGGDQSPTRATMSVSPTVSTSAMTGDAVLGNVTEGLGSGYNSPNEAILTSSHVLCPSGLYHCIVRLSDLLRTSSALVPPLERFSI